jgi:hypothetical protein
LRTARPKPSKKFSLSNVNREFNNSVRVDIFYLDGVYRRPILHAVDTRTSFSMARLCKNRDLELLASTFEREWVHVHGPPAEVSGDQEFAQGYFQDMLRRTISLSANKVHADITKRESLSKAMAF